MEEDNFYDAFKKSSETDRDFDYKDSNWHKVKGLLDADDENKRRKWLSFLPWVLASAMLGFCLLLFKNQKETNIEIKKLIAENNSTKILKSDTIIKYIFIHDTIIKNRIIHEKGVLLPENRIVNIANSSIPSLVTAHNPENSGVDNKKPKESNAENLPEMKAIYEKRADKSSEGTINDLSSVDEKSLLSNTKEKDTLKIDDKIVETTITIPKTQEYTALQKPQNTNTEIVKEETLPQKKEKPETQKYKFSSEFGPYIGFLIPVNKNVTKQYGYNLGLSWALNISQNIQIQLKGAYTRLHFESYQFNDAIGIPIKDSPNQLTGYVLENANVRLPTLNFELGFGYTFPTKTALKPMLSIGYGGRYLLPAYAHYTFISSKKDDIVVEAPNKSKQFIWNNFIPSFGFKSGNKSKWNWQFNSFYNFNFNSKKVAAPSYFGINSSLFYSL